MSLTDIIERSLEHGKGVLRLAPTWVPRSFCRPGRRIKLHPDDYYMLGSERGGIDERWFASTVKADNGPGTPEDEGLSYIVADEAGNSLVLLREAVEYLKGHIIGDYLWEKYRRWPMFSKFFDNMGPLPHHVHHRKEHASRVGREYKPEMYFFPSQMNNHGGEFPFTFFGFNPESSRDEIKSCLEAFRKGDNKLVDHSQCYKLTLDTGWDVPPGLMHAPGSLCTYEPQFASDVYAMYQSVLNNGQCVPETLLWKDTPEEEAGNFDYLMDVLDWELNTDPDLHKNRFMKPIPVNAPESMKNEGYIEEWICYRCGTVSAKRLTIMPKRTVRVKDNAAYGFILLQGYGRCGVWNIETPILIRYGQLTNDEFFVTYDAAKKGVEISNLSSTEPIVMLKHFAGNPDLRLEG